MSSSFEKSVKGATKIKVRHTPFYTSSCYFEFWTLLNMTSNRQLLLNRSTFHHDPRPFSNCQTNSLLRYIEHILIATHAGEAGVAEVFRALQNRLRDSTWTVVFKSLITVHLMIREGSPDVTLAYLARHRNMLAISNFSDGAYRRCTSAGRVAVDIIYNPIGTMLMEYLKCKHKDETFGIIRTTWRSVRDHSKIQNAISYGGRRGGSRSSLWIEGFFGKLSLYSIKSRHCWNATYVLRSNWKLLLNWDLGFG